MGMTSNHISSLYPFPIDEETKYLEEIGYLSLGSATK